MQMNYNPTSGTCVQGAAPPPPPALVCPAGYQLNGTASGCIAVRGALPDFLRAGSIGAVPRLPRAVQQEPCLGSLLLCTMGCSRFVPELPPAVYGFHTPSPADLFLLHLANSPPYLRPLPLYAVHCWPHQSRGGQLHGLPRQHLCISSCSHLLHPMVCMALSLAGPVLIPHVLAPLLKSMHLMLSSLLPLSPSVPRAGRPFPTVRPTARSAQSVRTDTCPPVFAHFISPACQCWAPKPFLPPCLPSISLASLSDETT